MKVIPLDTKLSVTTMRLPLTSQYNPGKETSAEVTDLLNTSGATNRQGKHLCNLSRSRAVGQSCATTPGLARGTALVHAKELQQL